MQGQLDLIAHLDLLNTGQVRNGQLMVIYPQVQFLVLLSLAAVAEGFMPLALQTLLVGEVVLEV
jgi:hypothetical protein